MEGVEWIKRESTVLIFSVELWNFLYETKLVGLGTAEKERERAKSLGSDFILKFV